MRDPEAIAAIVDAAERYARETLAERWRGYAEPDPVEFRRICAEAVLNKLREVEPA